MWEWSSAVAEYAAAGTGTSPRPEGNEPKYGESEYWTETVEGESEEGEGIAARDLIGEYNLAG